ncbi:hypothetical protein TSTA_031130 [Talaromyces stipitatus ATCC 10500]|uniref:Uncharacterized protein n=1 Tax=Talaromyces stipitatus (strain ATCC 10500 / CBS 375.48 / QM 6759 / NRRL 1006) TaxID=441959 RepID=B8M7X1_TALSN|nr:uncharacterized protein TSTA_031130 [Talaromyces stipitatus ATCC 10500]EED19850.1 hypothetical protein TSTA_031130 [Talaromyces stipitatus ATCC 10500]
MKPAPLSLRMKISMTSEPPEDLVLKYEEYAHRDPKGERRIDIDTFGVYIAGRVSGGLPKLRMDDVKLVYSEMLATGILRSALDVEESQEMSEILFVKYTRRMSNPFFGPIDSGLPSSRLKARWEYLRLIPSGDYCREEDQEVLRAGIMCFGLIRKRRKLDCAARQYLSAKPGE